MSNNQTLHELRAEFGQSRFLAMPIAGGPAWSNELDRLFGLTIMMANFVWAIGIPFYMIEPSSLPLSVGIFLGLMWIPFSCMCLLSAHRQNQRQQVPSDSFPPTPCFNLSV